MEVKGCMVRPNAPAKIDGRGRNPKREAACCMHCGSLLVRVENSPLLEIVSQVSVETGVPISLIMGNTRRNRVVHARHLAIYRCRKETNRPLPEIGDFFGMRERSTIRNAIRIMEKKLGPILRAFKNNGNQRLTPAQVIAIRDEYATLPFDHSRKRIGIGAMQEKYGISRRHLYAIAKREIWKGI